MTNSLPVPTRGDVFAVVFTLLFPVSLTLVYLTLLADASAATQYLVYGSLKLIQFGFPLLWVVAIQRGRLKPHAPESAGLLAGRITGTIKPSSMATATPT